MFHGLPRNNLMIVQMSEEEIMKPPTTVVVRTFTLMYITAAFIVDVLYAYVDPRIRYA